MKPIYKKGFTIFFASLVASLALAIGLAIYDLTIRELLLSETVTQSQYASYAADTGAECALYWDYKYNGTGSVFATSSVSSPPASGILCNTQDIAAGSGVLPFGAWQITSSASAATTTFEVSLGATVSAPCVMVTVAKHGNPSQTTMVSNGFNTCGTSLLKLERTYQVSY